MLDEIKSGFYYKGEKIENVALRKKSGSITNADYELLDIGDEFIINNNSEDDVGFKFNDDRSEIFIKYKNERDENLKDFGKSIDGFKFNGNDIFINNNDCKIPSFNKDSVLLSFISGVLSFKKDKTNITTTKINLIFNNKKIIISNNGTVVNEIDYDSPYLYIFTCDKGNSFNEPYITDSKYANDYAVWHFYCPGSSSDTYVYIFKPECNIDITYTNSKITVTENSIEKLLKKFILGHEYCRYTNIFLYNYSAPVNFSSFKNGYNNGYIEFTGNKELNMENLFNIKITSLNRTPTSVLTDYSDISTVDGINITRTIKATTQNLSCNSAFYKLTGCWRWQRWKC